MSNITYGYIRISSKDQNEDRQRIAMRAAGVPQRSIFMDKHADDLLYKYYTNI